MTRTVLCASLGGTKVQLGVLTPTRRFIEEPEILWRSKVGYESDAVVFAQWLVGEMHAFVARNGLQWSDIDIVGVPFPGPRHGLDWYSNNLPKPFATGVAFDNILNDLMDQSAHAHVPLVEIAYDAQCDAAGELFHPLGRLRESAQDATVINFATGVAAGFIADGQLLRTTADYRDVLHPSFDVGMGQLGRHLWLNDASGRWEYHPTRFGEIPEPGDARSRLTDRLGGPGLAARLIQCLYAAGLHAEVVRALIPELENPAQLATEIQSLDVADAAQHMRQQPGTVVRTLLQWLDDAYLQHAEHDRARTDVSRFAQTFMADIVAELAAAIDTFSHVALDGTQPWRRFTRNIVLTGGVGIHLGAGADHIDEWSVVHCIERHLPGTSVRRSCLVSATERESYFFRAASR